MVQFSVIYYVLNYHWRLTAITEQRYVNVSLASILINFHYWICFSFSNILLVNGNSKKSLSYAYPFEYVTRVILLLNIIKYFLHFRKSMQSYIHYAVIYLPCIVFSEFYILLIRYTYRFLRKFIIERFNPGFKFLVEDCSNMLSPRY